MKLTMNIATRGRPELLIKTLEHTMPNVSRDDTIVMVSVDEDDGATLGALKFMPTDSRIRVSVKPREDSRGEKYDRALTENPADVYLPAVDCAPILTPAWDQIIINAARLFPDGIGCVYTPMANASFPGLQAPTSGLVAKLGYIYNHEYPYWFIDHELDDISRMLGRFVFAQVDFSHRPWRPGTTIRLRDLVFWTQYFDLMAYERRLKARAIIDSPDFDCPDWYKTVLKTQFPVVEARSSYINAGVRQAAAQIEQDRGDKTPVDKDPGYQRALAAAQAKVAALLKQAA